MRVLFRKLGITDRASFYAFVKQFFKFGIVGVSNTLIALAVYYSLIYMGIHYLIANVVAFFISVCNAYFWNSRFVFKKKAGEGARTFLRTIAAYGSTALLGTFLLFVMVDILHISEWIAPLIGLCITIPLNFLLNKFWTYRQTKQGA
ncbi:MAG: GtrA family protein [Lachnospiraceae bacterium]|jgi:putative flippase GtrA|nr:GtrA family protein [Lachnospiraceae bacterium]